MKTKAIDVVLVVLAMLIALALRVVPAYPQVFRDGRVIFAANDAWIHMRNVDNAVAHAPSPGWFDPYRLGPEGQWSEAPLMDVAIAAIARAVSFGAPSQRVVDVTGAWFPAVAGALIVVPVFLLTRRLFGVPAAWLAALLMAILPGQLFLRSLLGQTDHHVIEALLAATVLLFLITFLDGGAWPFVAAAGIALGLYLLAWSSGSFLILILLGSGLLLVALAAWWGESATRSCRAFAATFAIAAVIALPAILRLPSMALVLPLLLGGAAGLLILATLLDRMQRANVSRARIGLATAVVVVALSALAMSIPRIREQLAGYAARFAPSPGATTVGEVRPLLYATGHLSLLPVWAELTTASVLMLIGLGLLAVTAWRERSAAKIVFAAWSVAMIVATLGQIRFAYYLAIAAAILASAAAIKLSEGFQRGFAVAAIAAIVLYPNIPRALSGGFQPNLGPNRAWMQALDWMRTQTPEPFNTDAAYFRAYPSQAAAPAPAYTVMVWWDFGYWVTRVAHRVPASNPTQAGASDAATFYTSTDERQATRILDRLKSRYVIVDASLPVYARTSGQPEASQLDPMTQWAGIDHTRFFDVYHLRDSEGHLRPLFVYYPDYYRTMAIHLFAHGGDAWTPVQPVSAIRSRDVLLNGASVREIADIRRFPSWKAAQAFVVLDPNHWRIGGFDPLRSCVPLTRLTRFTSVMDARQGGHVMIFRVSGP
jgi:dolichyl-diphosphooligosaccharide--protein glycosyltransferase